MNEVEKKSFLTYAEAIIAESEKIRFEENVPASTNYFNMESMVKEPCQFYTVGYCEGRDKMAKELLTVMNALMTAEIMFCKGTVDEMLRKIAGDRRWKPRKN